MRLLLIAVLIWSGAAIAGESSTIPGRTVPPLPPPAGRVVGVGNADQLRAAISQAKDGDVITLADGTYQIVPVMWLKDKKNITIRGASGDPTKVILRGKGWDQGGDHDNEDILWIDSSENVTIANLTFTEVHSYGLKINADGGPKNINVYNCHFRDIGIRGIKGTKGDSGKNVSKGSVRFCVFENTKIPPSNWQFDGDYITSIDMMKLDDWTFADNVFKNIKGHNGQARGAIFIWVDSRSIVVERNIFVDCDRSVALGNPSNAKAAMNVKDAVCRNNVFVTTSADAAIELSGAENIRLLHNTIIKKDPASRGIRVVADSLCKDIQVAGNILCGSLELSGGSESNNYTGPLDGYFSDLAKGDLHLTAAATGVLNKGVALKEVKEDGDGHKRKDQPDLGAFEFAAPKRSGAESRPVASETTKPAVDGATHREPLIKALQSPDAKSNVKAFIHVMGREQDVRVKSASASGVTIDLDGNALPLTWHDLTDSDLVHVALALMADDADALLHAGALASSAKLDEQYNRILELLLKKDAAKAKQLGQLSGRR